MNDVIDGKLAKVKAVMEDRKPKVGQTQKNPLDLSSQDAITILKVRFAKGEIDKNQYEEMVKIIT